jgi:hypothetical protein
MTGVYARLHAKTVRAHWERAVTVNAPGHDRIIEKNTQILDNLDKIITTCEGCDDGEVVFGGKVAQLDDAS